LAETTAEQFEEWRTLYEMEPWGEERADIAAGILAGVIDKQEGKLLEIARKYMPFLKREPVKPQSEADMQKAWDAICNRMAKMQGEG
jgi:hypothetical protein